MISLDAVSTRDVDFLRTLPNFSQLCARGTLVRNVQSIFPSNTYPCHSSIITGVHPRTHGLIENVFTQPGTDDPDWRRDTRLLTVPTLYEKAAEYGCKVCSIFYPVTCGAPIKWNFPEVPGHLSLAERISVTLRGGSPWFILSSLLKNGSHLKKMAEPYIDEFTTHIALNAVKKKTDLLLLHLLDVDEHKHHNGPDSAAVKDALKRIDNRLGLLVRQAEQYWGKENTAFILFSDHGCKSVRQSMDPNDWLRESGLIYEEHSNNETRYDAFFHNAGGTAFLKIYNPQASGPADSLLEELTNKPEVRRLVTKNELAISGLDQEFIAGIEAADGFSFGQPVKGAHGYCLDHEDYQPFYLAVGNDISENMVTSGGCIIDICPLAARLLGIPLWPMDGRDRLREVL